MEVYFYTFGKFVSKRCLEKINAQPLPHSGLLACCLRPYTKLILRLTTHHLHWITLPSSTLHLTVTHYHRWREWTGMRTSACRSPHCVALLPFLLWMVSLCVKFVVCWWRWFHRRWRLRRRGGCRWRWLV